MSGWEEAIQKRANVAESIARDVARGFQQHQSEVERFRELDTRCDALMEEFHAQIWPAQACS